MMKSTIRLCIDFLPSDAHAVALDRHEAYVSDGTEAGACDAERLASAER
jgi:hypothetical protein